MNWFTVLRADGSVYWLTTTETGARKWAAHLGGTWRESTAEEIASQLNWRDS